MRLDDCQPPGACAIPPDVFDVAFGWDPRPEVDRLVSLASGCGIEPRAALELGCGTARLFPAFRDRLDAWVGLELQPAMAAYAARRVRASTPAGEAPIGEVRIGDMTDFVLSRRFDLIYTTANTIRHAMGARAERSLWSCVAEHLAPRGVFVADLELGFDAEGEKTGKPATWFMYRDGRLIHVSWCVTHPPDPATRICRIEWVFDVRDGEPRGRWRQSFDLRTYDADEFVAIATSAGSLILDGLYELRDPCLIPTPPDRAIGRHLVVLRKPA